MYHSRIFLSVGGSVWYTIRNLRCTVTIDSVLANSKTQNAFLFTVNAIFRHDYPLAVEPGSMPRPRVQKKLGEILYLLICCFLPCLSWLLRSRVRKSRRDLWIILYYIFRHTFCVTSLSQYYEFNYNFLHAVLTEIVSSVFSFKFCMRLCTRTRLLLFNTLRTQNNLFYLQLQFIPRSERSRSGL